MTVGALVMRLHRLHPDAEAPGGADRAFDVRVDGAGRRRGSARRIVGEVGRRAVPFFSHAAENSDTVEVVPPAIFSVYRLGAIGSDGATRS